MSWSAHGTAEVADSGELVEDPTIVSASPPLDFDWPAESVEQRERTLEAVQQLLESGCVGTGRFTFTIAGHANTGHAPAAGYANDCCSISLQQQT